MNVNDLIYKLKNFKGILRYPVPAYLKNNDPDHNGDVFLQEYGDDGPGGLKCEDLDYWNEDLFIGFRLVKEMGQEIPGEESKELLILEVYSENNPQNFLTRFKWLGTEEDFKYFIERYEELSINQNHFLLLLYLMFRDNIRLDFYKNSNFR